MRTKVLFMSLVLGCLWSCQQDETIEQTDGRIIKFTSVVIGDETLSRASGSTSIDVISMRTELDDKFTVFDLKKDTRSWGEFSKKSEVFFMLIILVCQSLWRVMKRVCWKEEQMTICLERQRLLPDNNRFVFSLSV